MEFVIVGAGGIGSVCAAFLARAGHGVRLVARGEHLAAIRAHGLAVRGLADFVASPVAVESADGDADVLIMATKTPDTEEALERVAGLRVATVFSMQNGVLKNAQLTARFGAPRVLGATTMVGATRSAPGVVDYTLDGITAVGELEGPRSERVDQLAQAWNDAGLAMLAVDDVLAHEWAKQALQAGAAPVAALTHLPSHLIWGTEPLARSIVLMAREVAQVAGALGIELSDYAGYGFDMRAVVSEPLEQAVARLLERGEELVAAGKTRIMLSMGQDIRAGRKTEIEETVGYVVQEGERLGVAVPTLRLACDLIRGIEEAQLDAPPLPGAEP